MSDVLPGETDGAAGHLLHAGDRPQQSRLARSIGAHQRNQLPLPDFDADTAQGLDAPVVAGKVLYREQHRMQIGCGNRLPGHTESYRLRRLVHDAREQRTKLGA